MKVDELIKELRSAKLASGDYVRLAHLICEAADKLEQYRDFSCVGCIYNKDFPSSYKCHGCYRYYTDRYTTKEDEE